VYDNIVHDTVYEDDTVVIYLEYHKDFPVVFHCTAKRWSKSVCLHFYSVWSRLRKVLIRKGYEEVYAGVDNKLLKKFATMYGFQTTGTSVLDSEGKIRELMVYPLT